MMINNRPATLYSPEDAEAQARILQAGDSDWTYEAIHDSKFPGRSCNRRRFEEADVNGSVLRN